MPIHLDDIESITNAPPKATSPKFFSKSLTGSGGKRGLVNHALRPGRYPSGSSRNTLSMTGVNRKAKSTGGNVTTRVLPMAPLTTDTLMVNQTAGLTLPIPQKIDMFDVTANHSGPAMEVYLDLQVQSVMLHEDENDTPTTRTLNVLYRMEVYVLKAGSTSERVEVMGIAPTANAQEFVMVDWSYAPLDDAGDLIRNATHRITAQGNGIAPNSVALTTWMGDYDVHEKICEQADIWASDDIADIVSRSITELFANGTPGDAKLNCLAHQLRYLETYGVSLSAYQKLYATLNAVCAPDLVLELSKQNLNLLMNQTLEDLSAKKAQLATPPRPGGSAPPLPAHFSTQQHNAITTDEPLVLVQAGAGTGKSTVIEGRIAHLIARGVNPGDITVLSFTNAAADHLQAKCPDITSMTIARMLHDIYRENHPTHDLSSMDTILNSLDIFYPSSNLAHAFRKHLMDVTKNQTGANTALNSFIEKNYDEVIEVLDTLGQTCLELEIIIAYQRINTMAEPAHVQSKYLIIDEVQDNSIFEFIYLLKYVAKHNENMFIVGDAAQTLYEFRAANPRALNALSVSGVFQTYQLTTNYRSNQPILDFANVHLADIQANDAAQLRLQANSLQMPTANDFREKVNLHYQVATRLSDFDNSYPSYIHSITGEYIDACLARGEQVAFLMFTRAMVKVTEETLARLYPKEKVANLVNDRPWDSTVFSQYIKLFWNDVRQVPNVADASLTVTKGIEDNIDQLTRNATKSLPFVRKAISDWWLSSRSAIDGWISLVTVGVMTRDQFFNNLRDSLLGYEISHNAVKQSLMNEKNRARKEANLQSDARLVVSTIHGAKGLEFDNTVVIHKFDPAMEEDNKRMYYVAFTRAMKSTFILSYGKIKNPRITSDYDLVVQALERRDNLTQMKAQGLDPDAMSDDEVEAALNLLDAKSREAVSGPQEGPSPKKDEPQAMADRPGSIIEPSSTIRRGKAASSPSAFIDDDEDDPISVD